VLFQVNEFIYINVIFYYSCILHTYLIFDYILRGCISQNTRVSYVDIWILTVISINLVKSQNSNDCIAICLINYLNSCISAECDFLGLRIFSCSPVLFYNRLQISSILAFCTPSISLVKAFKSCW